MSQPTPLTEPILNNPWDPPTRYWVLDPQTNQATDSLKDGRRPSSGRILAPRSRKAPVQPMLGDEGSEPFNTINELRGIVAAWRAEGYPGATDRTRRLLEWWASGQPELRPFFCQREAVETAIWLVEAGQIHDPGVWSGLAGRVEEANHNWNDDIARLAFKMATGSGKTVVMAMLMIWHAVNHAMPHDFLIIAPNLTVKDRLAELRADHPEYLLRQLTPLQFQADLNRLRVTILNFQAFQRRNVLYVNGPGDTAPAAVKRVLRKSDDPRWEETDAEMLNRLLPSHRSNDPLVVINDEAHHCYRMEQSSVGKAGREVKDEEGRAALWFSALRALHEQSRLARVFDLSATPMYLRRPTRLLIEHFPWIVSDYPLSDAIEAGLTKIPRLPVDDDTRNDDPVYRDVYKQVKPKSLNGESMHGLVRDLLRTMHQHYAESVAPAYAKHDVIPVMIVVANNIANATALFRWIAGYRNDEGLLRPGQLGSFANIDRDGYVEHPPTLLVHSQLGDAESEGKQALQNIAAEQAGLHAPKAKTKKEQVQAIRDIFNSVGRKGEPGEHIRCVISVGMLTEGWDAKTVTHIFGFRAFTSQLLCEQVTGRALRRTSFEPDQKTGALGPEYANVFGVPYEFMRGVDNPLPPTPPKEPYTVEPVPGREHLRIQFPNLNGYAWAPPEHRCRLDLDAIRGYNISAPDDPSETVASGTVGESAGFYDPGITLDLAVWRTAAKAVEQFQTEERQRRSLFPAMLAATREWLSHPKVRWVEGSLETQFQWLLRAPHDHNVPAAIASVVRDDDGEPTLLPVFADLRDPMQPRLRSTEILPFKTTVEPVWPKMKHESTAKSELNRAPCHSNPELRVAEFLDAHPQVEAWARNFRLGWTIPWRDHELGQWRSYEPDFVARVLVPDGAPPLHLLIECKGARFDDDSAEAKANTVDNLWIPAVERGLPEMGRWHYVYPADPSSIADKISGAIAEADHA